MIDRLLIIWSTLTTVSIGAIGVFFTFSPHCTTGVGAAYCLLGLALGSAIGLYARENGRRLRGRRASRPRTYEHYARRQGQPYNVRRQQHPVPVME